MRENVTNLAKLQVKTRLQKVIQNACQNGLKDVFGDLSSTKRANYKEITDKISQNKNIKQDVIQKLYI